MGIFNILDILALILFCLCVMHGIRSGFLRMAFGFLSLMAALYISQRLYPYVGAFLKDNTGIYEAVKTHIISSMGLGDIIENYIAQGEAAILSNLPLPGFMLDMLTENNTPFVRHMLGAYTLEDYIGSFLANIFMNILSAAIVFILLMIIMRSIGGAINIIAKLPIIRSFNKLGGAVAGALIGFVAIWILVTLYLFFFVSISPSDGIFNNSLVGQFLYDRDLLLRGLTDIR